MNSVAIPAAASNALSTESDLIRLAARSDSDAFGELYRRHSQAAWRLAHAVATTREGAIAAVSDGFAHALLGQRRARGAAGGESAFRPVVLASVYRSAVESLQAAGSSARPLGPASAKSADEALTESAFRSLPERWRAAVWLSEVEGFDAERVAPVLGVSTAVATQLIARGRRGLLGRFAQAHREAPEHLGSILRIQAAAVPANLGDAVEERWAAVRRTRKTVLAPATGWLEDRAVRPMWVAVGTLVGIGLIGLGIVPGGTAVHSNLGTAGSSTSSGAIPIGTSVASAAAPINLFPVLNPSATGSFLTAGAATASGAFSNLGTNTTTTSGSTGGSTTTSGGGTTTNPGSSSGTTTSGGTGSGTGSGGSGTGSGTGTGTSGSGSGGTTTSGQTTKTIINAGPVATVTQTTTGTSSSLNVTLLPGSSLPVTVTVPCTTVIVVSTCTPSTSSTSPSTTVPASNPVATVVGGVVAPVVGAVTNLITPPTTLLPGL